MSPYPEVYLVCCAGCAGSFALPWAPPGREGHPGSDASWFCARCSSRRA